VYKKTWSLSNKEGMVIGYNSSGKLLERWPHPQTSNGGSWLEGTLWPWLGCISRWGTWEDQSNYDPIKKLYYNEDLYDNNDPYLTWRFGGGWKERRGESFGKEVSNTNFIDAPVRWLTIMFKPKGWGRWKPKRKRL
jgi:hypothetical protein